MEIILIAIIGLCIGSFLNVCIYRIPREESISFPPSHCTNCNHKLQWYELIPVFSYIFLKGKCKNCKEKISLQYPLIELTNAILYVLVFLKYQYSLDTIKFMVLVSFLIVIGVIDLKTKFVYNSTMISMGIVAVVFLITYYAKLKSFPIDNILGGILGLVIIGLIVFITRGMGEGDIEIAAISGLFLGLKGEVFMLFFAVILGGIVGAIILIVKRKSGKTEMPFGPFLAIAAITAIFYGNFIINQYLTMNMI